MTGPLCVSLDNRSTAKLHESWRWNIWGPNGDGSAATTSGLTPDTQTGLLWEAAQRGPSHGHRGVGVFGSAVDDVLHLSRVGHVVARLVLGQDLHERTQLQPPLLFGNAMAAKRKLNIVFKMSSKGTTWGSMERL